MCVVQWDGFWKWQLKFEIGGGGGRRAPGGVGSGGERVVVCCELGVPTAASFG